MCVPLRQGVCIDVIKGEEGKGAEERCRCREERSEDRTDRSDCHFPRADDECDEDTKDPKSLPVDYQVANTPLPCFWSGTVNVGQVARFRGIFHLAAVAVAVTDRSV